MLQSRLMHACRTLPQTLGRNFSSTTAKSGTVGFIGLGNMGLPMAVNVANKSHDVIAFDLNPDSIAMAKEQGIEVADSVETVAKNATSFVTMLPNDAIVGSVMDVVQSNCAADALVVDCSTVSPSTSRMWNEKMGADGHLFVDAPVSGGVVGATNGTLTFMVGSTEEEMKDRVTPLLECMGARIVPCGGAGAGSAVKLCNNLALATQMLGICEAMHLGESLGVDPVTLASVINTSTGKSWSCEVNNPHPDVAALTGSPASKDYNGGFGASLMLKDLGLAVSTGADAKVALPLANASKELYQLVAARGLGDKDFGIALQFLKGK